MRSKFLMASVAGAALLAFSPAEAQENRPGDCDEVGTVGGILDRGSCTLFDKEFSNFSFDQLIPDSTSLVIDVEILPNGDVFSLTLGELQGVNEQNQTFSWSYSIEITGDGLAMGNEFDAIGLSHQVGELGGGDDVTTTKVYDTFDVDDTEIDSDLQLQVSGGDTTTDSAAIGEGIVRIDVEDTVQVGATGVFNGASNEFQQRVSRVPLPATLGLFGMGLLGLAYSVRRKA